MLGTQSIDALATSPGFYLMDALREVKTRHVKKPFMLTTAHT
jgi:hypothetical protein